MLIRAAEELDLNLDASWMVGDMLSDILAGINARCRGSILVRTGKGLSEAEAPLDVTYQVADDLLAAADLILGGAQPTDDANGAGSARTESPNTLREPTR
jgi:D-glycero-D-manno-heptose 1,7-bisphosphate phosphatase